MHIVFTLGLGAVVLLAIVPYVFGEWLGRRRATREHKAEIVALLNEISRLRITMGEADVKERASGGGLRRIVGRGAQKE